MSWMSEPAGLVVASGLTCLTGQIDVT